jgi:hypothetical protein
MTDADTTTTRSPAQPRFTPRAADDPTYDVDPGKGWVLFAGIMLAIIGALNLLYGIAAVSDSAFYVRDVKFVISGLHTWGWLLIVIGAVQLLVAVGVFRASETARWLGIGFAAANIVVQFLILPASPLSAVMIFFVDVIIIFGLVTYGGRDRRSLA